MSNGVSGLLADIAVILSGFTAVGVLYVGWRKRVQDAARRPFLAGTAAIEEAQTALRLKDNRLAELTESEARLKSDLAAAKGTADAQQEQITKLQARLYAVEGENRDLRGRAENAERDAREAKNLIGQLQDEMTDLKRKLSLGGPPTF